MVRMIRYGKISYGKDATGEMRTKNTFRNEARRISRELYGMCWQWAE